MMANDSVQGGRRGVSVGNFELGECFCDARCRHGHKLRFLNIGRGHYLVCDGCRTFVFIGSNLVGSWRQEKEDVWRANWDSLRGYKEVRL